MTDQRTLRDGLGRFATGVTVITCVDADRQACGITANSFSSVSLTPPLVLWNIAKVSQSLEAYLAAEHFGINVLTASQRPAAQHFAASRHDRFAGIPHSLTARNVPRLADTLAWFECRTYRIHDCGDHHIIVGEVLDFSMTDAEPLLFFRGNYRHLDSLL